VIERIELNIIDVCNRSCSFCPRGNGYKNTSKRLTIEDSKILGKRLEGYNNIVSVSGLGEPLLHKEFVQVLDNAIPTSASKVVLITNGDYLTPEKYNEIKHIFTDIKVSLYDEDNSEYFKSFITETNLEFNHYYNGPTNTVNRVEIFKNVGKTTGSECYIPFYKLFIDFDLKTYLCSNDWSKRAPTGDLKVQSLDEAWNSEEFNKYRKDLKKGIRKMFPCNNCSVCGILEGKEHFNNFGEEK